LEDFKISCNGIDIEAKSSVKYLEIMIDQFLVKPSYQHAQA
jgi:hypothetical protein